MYNPINMQVEDEQRLQEKDQREKNKKKRYGARYIAEDSTRAEMLAEQERSDKMALSKVSNMRVAEEINRGFDILTNDQLRGGLAQIEATTYMKPRPKAWDSISPLGNGAPKVNAENQAEALNMEFQKSNFERRSRRLNTNLARTGPEAPVDEKSSAKPVE